jgi:hypothetical protein
MILAVALGAQAPDRRQTPGLASTTALVQVPGTARVPASIQIPAPAQVGGSAQVVPASAEVPTQVPAPTEARGSTQSPPAAPQRFDYQVRADFFAGVEGDAARLQKVMDLCEQTLADNPRHAEAMVWHGAARVVQSRSRFEAGDMAEGGRLFQAGLQEMSDAVGLAPDNPGVLIPRAAVLLEATKGMPPDMARPLLESGVASYEHVLEIQTPYFERIGDHAKGELLFGLAEGSARLGRQDKARAYFERLIRDAPTSGQVPRAKEWMASGHLPSGLSCVGCHK